jgi:hypothetical protein
MTDVAAACGVAAVRAVITAVPARSVVTRPLALTVAMVASDVVYVTVWFVVLPTMATS